METLPFYDEIMSTPDSTNQSDSTLPYDRFQSQLEELLGSSYPLIFIRSSEESRAINAIIAAHQKILQLQQSNGQLTRWSSTEGFLELTTSDKNSPGTWKRCAQQPQTNPNEDPLPPSINFLEKYLNNEVSKNHTQQYTYILPDWSALIEPTCHLTARKLKELVIAIESKRPRPHMSLIVVGTEWSIPSILRNSVYVIDLPLPIGQELFNDVFQVAVKKYNLKENAAKQLAEQAQGMSLQAATQTARLITTKELWTREKDAANLLLEVKKQEIRKTGVLEYYAPQGDGLSAVGGLENIKLWVENRKYWFEQDSSPEMRPRAILLEGFPGCGKTFIARAIAQEWGVPQINFEISRLQSKWVGESESNTFQALRAIEASAPNILFMDEIEKAFSGVGQDSSGVSTRQFGTFLSWLNDHDYPIFFIATSNNRSQLPPELFRAGRFDEIFIVMPPNTQERYEILDKRCQAYRLQNISMLDFLVESTVGFSGAELDKLVKEAKYIAYLSGRYDTPSQADWQESLAQIHPQSKTPKMKDLLQIYIQLLEDGSGKPASTFDNQFIQSLLN